MRRLLFGLSLLLLLVVLTVHGLALLKLVPLAFVEPAMGLHILAMADFIGSFLYFMVALRKAPPMQRASTWNFIRARAPRWVQVCLLLTLLYAMAGFVANIYFSAGTSSAPSGSAESTEASEPAEYEVQNHGKVIARLNKTEYQSLQNSELAGFSSLWILFVATASFLNFPARRVLESDGSARGDSSTREPGKAFDAKSGDASAGRFPSRFQSSVVLPVSWFRRTMAGAYGFVLGWTAFLAILFALGGLLLDVYFLFIPTAMFGFVTWLNFRYRKKQMRVLILEASVDGGAARIRFLEGDREETWNLDLHATKARIAEQVIRGNSLFRLEIEGPDGAIAQYTCRQWDYASLESLAKALGSRDIPT